jgi:hypothetical protein
MALFDWIFVVFGAAVALGGSWIQLHPECVIPRESGSNRPANWQLDPAALSQIRLLGACFAFMGTFFALQMTIILSRFPWWIGALSGLVAASSAVALVRGRIRHQQPLGRNSVHQTLLPKKILELR